MGIKIGNAELKYGLMLAPMAGVTDKTFRLICKRYGAEYSVSEMVSAKAMCYEQKAHRKEALHSTTATLAAVSIEEFPMAVQLFGLEPEFFAEAAMMIEHGSYHGCTSSTLPVAIDLNMGCPMRKITGNGEGSALMKDPLLAAKIVSAVRDATTLPVTVKIRAGWDFEHINAPELSKRLEQAGASAICVHARTREQMYAPGADWSVIADTKKAVSIPVIGNGDVLCGKDALLMMEQTGCDGVMIGRGAMGNPWIFSEIVAFLSHKKYVAPTSEERIRVACEHLERMQIEKGIRVGLSEAKKHLAWYIAGMRGAAAARTKLMNAGSAEEMKQVMIALLESEVNV